jgi:hypothetical protein
MVFLADRLAGLTEREISSVGLKLIAAASGWATAEEVDTALETADDPWAVVEWLTERLHDASEWRSEVRPS